MNALISVPGSPSEHSLLWIAGVAIGVLAMIVAMAALFAHYEKGKTTLAFYLGGGFLALSLLSAAAVYFGWEQSKIDTVSDALSPYGVAVSDADVAMMFKGDSVVAHRLDGSPGVCRLELSQDVPVSGESKVIHLYNMFCDK